MQHSRVAWFPIGHAWPEIIAREYGDLPGAVSIKATDSVDLFVRNEVAVLVEHDLGRRGRYAGYVTLSRRMLDVLDQEMLAQLVIDGVDRHLRPWRYPDRDRWPKFDLFPRTSRVVAWLRGKARR